MKTDILKKLNSFEFQSLAWWKQRVVFWQDILDSENNNLLKSTELLAIDKKSFEAKELARIAKDRIRNASINIIVAQNKTIIL
jgi:hypothetical protein